MNRIQSAYKDLFTILSSTNPFLVPLAFALAILSGVLPPVFVLASERLMTDGTIFSGRNGAMTAWLSQTGAQQMTE